MRIASGAAAAVKRLSEPSTWAGAAAAAYGVSDAAKWAGDQLSAAVDAIATGATPWQALLMIAFGAAGMFLPERGKGD